MSCYYKISNISTVPIIYVVLLDDALPQGLILISSPVWEYDCQILTVPIMAFVLHQISHIHLLLCNFLFVVKWKRKHKHTVDNWLTVINVLLHVKLTRVKTSHENEYLRCFIATHFSVFFQFLIENLTWFNSKWFSSSSLSASITTHTSIERK